MGKLITHLKLFHILENHFVCILNNENILEDEVGLHNK